MTFLRLPTCCVEVREFQKYLIVQKIDNLEKSIEDKFKRIDEEIDYKVKRWKTEMEWNLKDIRPLYPIFDDFTTGIKCHDYGKPIREQNKIDMILHQSK